MPDKKLPTGPIRIDAPVKKDDPSVIPSVLLNTHESTPKVSQQRKKVSMHLSVTAFDALKQFRLDTGIPYEILVEVMTLNFAQLPERTRKAYLDQAQEIRTQRLIAGQEKALETVRAKRFV
jgi:hypothetical protein